MADEAFALSPISARAALPSEADYDAIREAFMETSRGRWFLGEYAKRNRNADTAMVLDAVARIEQTMAVQRQEPARNDGLLLEAIAAIRDAVDRASEAASAAFNGLQLQENLTPIHKGTRIIKEISWRWREIGADGRICDLIDSQLASIEASCTRLTEADGNTALGAVFDSLKRKLDELADAEDAPAAINVEGAEEMVAPAAVTVQDAVQEPVHEPAPEEAKAPALEIAEPVSAEAPAEVAFAEPEIPAETTLPEVTVAEPEITTAEDLAAVEAEPAEMAADATAEAHQAEDEALLEMVALEMAAPDDSFGDFLPEEVAEVHTTLPPVVEPVIASPSEPPPVVRLEIVPPPRPRLEVVPPSPPLPQILPEPAPPVAPEASLGSTIIASGILQRPKAPSDPLAPIRRMSQAEKIAFFS